ncbi:MAG: FliM/FliN family flagellar motor switch protein [Rhizobiales bacterium]|nr:FliM/FliN family flagellar motor switch protein [Hyphomicrobiales bacterium]
MQRDEGKMAPGLAGAVSASLSKVPVTLQVILGAAHLPLSELMALKSGSEVKLDVRPGDPVTVLVNGCKIAKGELYVLDSEGDRFGVKISELFESAMPI